MTLKVRIVEGSCCGFANCVLRCPQVFMLDSQENRVRLLKETPPQELLPEVRHAVDECPTRAIEVMITDS